MNCNSCHKEKFIVNKHFKLCQECNNERLHGNKFGKQYEYTHKDLKSLRRRKNKTKNKQSLFAPKLKQGKSKEDRILDDEVFYKKCFNKSNHKCEECNTDLPTSFRDEDGRIVARWRYSHIIPKSIAPELRHKIKNINILCLACHQEWENGSKENMKIFAKNKTNFDAFF